MHSHDSPALPQDAAEYLEHGGQSGQAAAAAAILYSASLMRPASEPGELSLEHQPPREASDQQPSASPDADCVRAAAGLRPPSLTARPRVGVRKVVEVGPLCSCQLRLWTRHTLVQHVPMQELHPSGRTGRVCRLRAEHLSAGLGLQCSCKCLCLAHVVIRRGNDVGETGTEPVPHLQQSLWHCQGMWCRPAVTYQALLGIPTGRCS